MKIFVDIFGGVTTILDYFWGHFRVIFKVNVQNGNIFFEVCLIFFWGGGGGVNPIC